MGNGVQSVAVGTKERVFRRLPKALKSTARLAYLVLAMPFGGRRSINRLKFQSSVRKTERINFVPPIFSVTINSTCNLRCPNCFYVLLGEEKAFEGGGMIKVEDFKAIIDKYGKYVELVSLTGGEALAHPKLDELVNIVKSKGVKVCVSTNGVFIERKFEVLKNFDSINVSLDGFDYESFKRYRAGTPEEFDKILHGLELLRKNNIPFGTSFVLSEENVHEVNFMLEIGHKTGASRVTFHNINAHGCEDFTSLKVGSEKVQRMLDEVTSRNDYSFDIELPIVFDLESKDFASQKCTQQWSMVCFNDKGHLSYCCYMDHDPSIGNMFQGYDFNAEKMRTFRSRMIKNEYPKDTCFMCQRRFAGQEYGNFYASQKVWILKTATVPGDKVIPLSPTTVL
jgi:MoaA/NifB/PqqE/SkfB family radical SAM enzyme